MASFKTLISGVQDISELKSKIESVGLSYKEDDNFIIVYSDENDRTNDEIHNEAKSIIISKATLQPIVSQFNKPYYNDDAETFLKDKDWNQISVKYCIEGTMIIVFYENSKWYICTRKCLDAMQSKWIRGISYHELFMDAINGKFKLDDLDKSLCYHFILVHHKNRNIVDYTAMLDDYYKTVALVMVTEKYTLIPKTYYINDRIMYPTQRKFKSIDELKIELAKLSECDEKRKSVTTEGFIIEYIHDGNVTVSKIQSRIYQTIEKMKPNTSNLDTMFLGLYQIDKLPDIVPYFTNQEGEVINRIHTAMRVLSSEILDLYHSTRSHKNEELYESLPSSYKCILYTIHGLYIKKRTTEIEKNKTSEIGDKKSVTVYDVYGCIKHLDTKLLRKIFIDRLTLLENENIRRYLDIENFDIVIQGKLMM